jgi:hypothetical protein
MGILPWVPVKKEGSDYRYFLYAIYDHVKRGKYTIYAMNCHSACYAVRLVVLH